MKLPFRQGIIRYQTDTNNNPLFLQKSNGGASIDLVVSPDPTLVSFAHGPENYLFEERLSVNEAWTGFQANTDYWLYWDLDLLSCDRTFGATEVEPVYGPNPPAQPIANDQHWFDTRGNQMITKVWNGVSWVEKIRVFACKYDEGAIIEHYPVGSQVSVLGSFYAGFILFDDEDKPVRKHDRRGRGKFLTTESVFTTHSSKLINVAFETVMTVAEATENIPAYSLVKITGPDQIGLASHLDQTEFVAGLVREDFYMNEIGAYSTGGYITNEQWDWQEPAGTPLFCGEFGELLTDVPQVGTIQQVGKIVSPQRILLDIRPPIILEQA